ncbi:hypothetical protein [Bacteroides thetaiotaomicron]|uniref:hypothetical protein n=1 Tax=Bacteroides thetaiotaomicron TaxID=818 RepID=UPI0034A145A8
MGTKILKEKSRVTQVDALAKVGEYEYQVSYSYDGNELRRLICNINKVTELNGTEDRVYSGYMSFENGNKSMNFPADVEVEPHVAIFEDILQEVRGDLTGI